MRTRSWAAMLAAIATSPFCFPSIAGGGELTVENTGVVTRPMVAGQALPETHNVHTIRWTDDNSVAGESYNIYVSDQPITDIGAANVYRIGTQIPEGQQAYQYALLTPFIPGVVTNYYAVTLVSSTGLEDTQITPGNNATTTGTEGTTEFGQPIFWFTAPPVVDAEFGDWAPFRPVYLSPDDLHFLGGTSDGPQDQSGYVGMGINDTDLFFLGEVTDDALVNTFPTGDGSIWNGDGIEYYIGFYDLRPGTPRHPTTQWGNAADPTKAEPDWQLDIAGNAFSEPNRSQNYCAGVCGAYQTGMGNLGLQVLTKETATGWNLEARQPLVGLAQDPAVIAPFRPKIGMILPTNLALADGDDPAGQRQGELLWAKDPATYNSWNTPSAWEKEQVIYDPKVFALGWDVPPTARFNSSSSSLAFGNTKEGSTLQKTLTLSNTGTAELVITGMSIQGPDAAQFQVSPTTVTIAAGRSQPITVTFAPTSTGNKSASLSIAHNAAGSSSTQVALSGTGDFSGPVVNNFWLWRGGGIFPGEPVNLRAQVTAGNAALTSVQVLVRPQLNEPPIATVTLRDDGVAPDSTANDGTFSGRWAGTSQVGGYTLDLVAEDVVGRQNTPWRQGITVAHTLVSTPDAMLISPEQLRTSKVPVLIEDDGDGYLSEKKFLSVQVWVHNWSQGLEPLGMHMDTTGALLGGKAGLLDTNATMSFQPDRKWNVMLALSSADSLQLLPGAQPQQGILAYIRLDSMLVNTGYAVNTGYCNFGVNNILFNEDGMGAVATSWGNNLALGRGDIDTSGVIGPFDAALVLMHVVGKANLDWGQDAKNDAVEARYHFTLPSFTNYMADVSGQMGITALDAALILRRDVGLIAHFPVEEGYYRLWDPPAPGSWWNPPNAKPVVAMAASRLNRVVSLGAGEAREDGQLAFPVLIDQLEGVLAGSLVLGYDPHQLQVVGVEAGELTGDYLWDYQVQRRELRLAFAGAESRPGSGPLAQVVFARVGVGGSAGVVLRQSQLNEEAVVNHEAAAVSAVVPGQLVLQANYPNPFNPSTAVGYELPGDSQVRLGVYGLLGQRIRLLVEERQEAGIHQVVWDGRDGQGQVVASGVYLYRLETEGGVLVRRMLLLK